MRKKLLYTKNTYIRLFKLLLNLVTFGIEALVLSRNKFLYACVKEVCRLWAQPRFDTFHQLRIIVEALRSQPVLQKGKRVVVAQSEIRTVRRVVKQLPVQMLQQCSSASSSMRTHIDMQEHCIVCQHSMTFVLNGPTQFFFYCFAVHVWCYCGPLLHEFHHPHSFPVPENNCDQLSGRQTTFV
jgi:hypothetical protein